MFFIKKTKGSVRIGSERAQVTVDPMKNLLTTTLLGSQLTVAYTVNVSDQYVPKTQRQEGYEVVEFSGVTANHTPRHGTTLEGLYSDSFSYDYQNPTASSPGQAYASGANLMHTGTLTQEGVSTYETTLTVSGNSATDISNPVLVHVWGRNNASFLARDNDFTLQFLRDGEVVDSLNNLSIADTTDAFLSTQFTSSDDQGFDQVLMTSSVDQFTLAEIRIAVYRVKDVELDVSTDTNYITFRNRCEDVNTALEALTTTAIANGELSTEEEIQQAVATAAGVDVSDVAVTLVSSTSRELSTESETSLSNPEVTSDASIADSVMAGSGLVGTASDLALNGAYHRTLHNRLRGNDRIEWATYDFESSDSSDLKTSYFEVGLANRFNTDTWAFGASFGYLNASNAYTTSSGDNDFSADSISLTGEVDKSFFGDRLVVSALGNLVKNSAKYSRTATLSTVTSTAYTDSTVQEFNVGLTNAADNTITAVFDPITLSGVSDTVAVLTIGSTSETYVGESSGLSHAIRLRADYLLLDNDAFTLKPRIAYTHKQTQMDRFEEEGGVYNNTYGAHDIANTQMRIGVDLDFHITDRFEIRLMGDQISSTTAAYDLEVSNVLTTDPVSYEVPELSLTYQRVGVEFGYFSEDSAQYYFLISKTQGDLEATSFSVTFQNSF